MGKMQNKIMSLVIRMIGFVGAVACIYASSSILLPWQYSSDVEFIDGSNNTMPTMLAFLGLILIVFGFTSIAALGRPKEGNKIFLWITMFGIIGHLTAMFFFVLPSVCLMYYGIPRTIAAAHKVGVIAAFVWLMFMSAIFEMRHLKRKPNEPTSRLPKRPKHLSSPKDTAGCSSRAGKTIYFRNG